MSFVVVVRDTRTGVSRVWKGKEAPATLRRALKHVLKHRLGWSKKADDYILRWFNQGPSSSTIARNLSRMLSRNVTKNMVIGRYHRLRRQIAKRAAPAQLATVLREASGPVARSGHSQGHEASSRLRLAARE